MGLIIRHVIFHSAALKKDIRGSVVYFRQAVGVEWQL